jgi:hypothetical protein
MSFWGSLTGEDQANAAKQAAADTYAKQQAATTGITDYGNDYANQFRTLGQGYNPYIQTGNTANMSIQNLLADPSSFTSTPYYQSGLAQGNQAIQNSALGNGGLFSGKTGKDLQKYGEDYFNNKYNSYLGTLQGLSNSGLSALGAQNTTIGTGLQGQLGTRQSAYQGNMQSASTIGNGEIAAANAEGAGVKNLVNLGMGVANLGLSALGGGGGLSSLSGALGLGGGGGTAGVMQVGNQYYPKYS